MTGGECGCAKMGLLMRTANKNLDEQGASRDQMGSVREWVLDLFYSAIIHPSICICTLPTRRANADLNAERAMMPPYTHKYSAAICTYTQLQFLHLQSALRARLHVALDLIADLEVLPAVERDTALGVLAHGLDVLLLVLDVVDDA